MRSALKDWTGFEIEEKRLELTQAAASILGHMLFEFSRLDCDLALCLVWNDHGRQLESETATVSGLAFSAKLHRLKRMSAAKYANDPKALSDYGLWLDRADTLRQKRNELVHGRWGVEAVREKVVNVVGIPTSPAQLANAYSIADLEQILDALRSLRTDFLSLSHRIPI